MDDRGSLVGTGPTGEPTAVDLSLPFEVKHTLAAAARVTVVEHVYYQQMRPPGEPVDLGCRTYSVGLATDEQPVPGRVQKVGSEWAPLQLLYLAGEPVSELVVENLEGRDRQHVPSADELADTARRVVELGTAAGPSGVVVRPGRACRFEPSETILARCRSGTARVRVAATPGDADV